MPPSTNPRSDVFDLARCALLSALRRRGLIPREDPTNGAVTVEFGHRAVTVLLTEDGWVRRIPGRLGSTALIARIGCEEALARQLARELLDRLP